MINLFSIRDKFEFLLDDYKEGHHKNKIICN